MVISVDALKTGIDILIKHQQCRKPDFSIPEENLNFLVEEWYDYFSRHGMSDDFFIKGCKKVGRESRNFPTVIEIIQTVETLYEPYDPSNLRKFIKSFIVGYQPYRSEDADKLSPEQLKEIAVWEDRYDTVYLELDRILRKYHEHFLVNPDLKTICNKILTRSVCAEVLQRFDFIDTEKILNGDKPNQICGK